MLERRTVAVANCIVFMFFFLFPVVMVKAVFKLSVARREFRGTGRGGIQIFRGRPELGSGVAFCHPFRTIQPHDAHDSTAWRLRRRHCCQSSLCGAANQFGEDGGVLVAEARAHADATVVRACGANQLGEAQALSSLARRS